MKRILLLLILSTLCTPAFSQAGDAGQSFRQRFHIEADTGATPGFFRREFHTNCGTFHSGDGGDTSAEAPSGQTLSFHYDRQNRMIGLVVGSDRWTGFLDAQGHLVEIHDPHGGVSRHTPLSDADAQATINAHAEEFTSLLAHCGIKVATVKCGLDDHSFAATKSVCDPMGDSTTWSSYFNPEYESILEEYMQLIDFETREQCLARRQNCMDSANAALAAGGGLCLGLYVPPYVLACETGNVIIYGIAFQRCQAISC